MKEVAIITGGGSGMGFEAARCMDKERIIVLAGRTVAKLERAVAQLQAEGHEAHAHACDTSSRASVRSLAEYAASLGTLRIVINSAGLSPAMAGAEQLLRVNALGTVYVNQECARVMPSGGVIVDVASNSAYLLPKFLLPRRKYPLAERDEEDFVRALLKRSSIAKDGYARSGMAYSISKNFTVWYAQRSAFELGARGIRVCSLSPGLIATDMGNLEAKDGAMLLTTAAEHRMGTPEELGFALAAVADPRNGYLAGVDVLVDGGSVNGRQFLKK